MPRCIQCGKDTLRSAPTCHECLDEVLVEADRNQLPVIGRSTGPSARRIGFSMPEPRDAGVVRK